MVGAVHLLQKDLTNIAVLPIKGRFCVGQHGLNRYFWPWNCLTNASSWLIHFVSFVVCIITHTEVLDLSIILVDFPNFLPAVFSRVMTLLQLAVFIGFALSVY